MPQSLSAAVQAAIPAEHAAGIHVHEEPGRVDVLVEFGSDDEAQARALEAVPAALEAAGLVFHPLGFMPWLFRVTGSLTGPQPVDSIRTGDVVRWKDGSRWLEVTLDVRFGDAQGVYMSGHAVYESDRKRSTYTERSWLHSDVVDVVRRG